MNTHQQHDTAQRVRLYFESRDLVRRGICLLNAGQYESAAQLFRDAMQINPDNKQLHEYLAQCHLGCGELDNAAEQMAELVRIEPGDITARIRHAMLLWKKGATSEAIESLRQSVADSPDCAEIHFQLGTLLASVGEQEEAELRFTQAVALDGRHVEAMTSLALCLGAQHQTERALSLLRRAQELRPNDPSIGFWMANALRVNGVRPEVNAPVFLPPNGDLNDTSAVTDLSRIIESEPEFIEAFLELPAGRFDTQFFQFLSMAIRQSLDCDPKRADLHYQLGRVLDRMGDESDAIDSIEHALTLDPKYINALIQLGRIYQKTDRLGDATNRLERALKLGAEYADVYLLLGNLYRDRGETERARDAYQQAIRINDRYECAQEALKALAGSEPAMQV